MSVHNLPALLLTILFYFIILGVGIWASRMADKKAKKADPLTIALLANRNINLLVGIFTLTATWVGGGFILGIAEIVYRPTQGLVWALVPVAYIITFFLGGLFFAKPMRENKYMTMMDPFQKKYGNLLSSLLLFPTLVADVLWVARTLVSIGGTMSVILGIEMVYSNLISAAVAIVYTLMGGFFSVAYTDVIQLILIFISLWTCIPFLLNNPNVRRIAETAVASEGQFQTPWLGKVESRDAGKWIDEFLLLALGGLAYQAFYQRILSASSYRGAQYTCFASAGFCLVLGIPPMLVGAVAASTDWIKTGYDGNGKTPYENGQAGAILPIALNYLTPNYISGLGLGAVAAAAMSSMDSALLSAASLFASNIYKNIIRKEATDLEMQWVIRISVIVTGVAGTGLTFLDDSVMIFWHFGVDMSYTILFPQLVSILFFDVSNSYGCLVGLTVGFVLRLLSGEPLIGLKPVIHFPGLRYDAQGWPIQYFPFRTTIVLITMVCILSVSWLAQIIFDNHESWDVFKIADKQAKVDAARKALKESQKAKKAAKASMVI